MSGAPATIPSCPRMSFSYDSIEKDELLGSGGNADVYTATVIGESGDISLAIKEPRMGGVTVDTDTIEKMLEEAETWQQLDDHEHIVSVVDFGSTPLPWIGMEYMDGGDLSERAGELPFEQTLWTALAITKGIRYAHKRGIAHLDIKPDNILFRSVEDAWDVPKIADWGLSKHLLEHSQSVEAISPRYAAPEQLDSGQFGEVDTVTDVYQLGAVLYELFTGVQCFDGNTYEVMNKIQSETPIPPSDRTDLPESIDDILLTALATERTDRYDDVLYIRDELRNLLNEHQDETNEQQVTEFADETNEQQVTEFADETNEQQVADYDDIKVTTSEDPPNRVVVTKSAEANRFPVPSVIFKISSNITVPKGIKIIDEIPNSFSMKKIGTHPEYYGDHWKFFKNHRAEFKYMLDPGEAIETVYGVRTNDTSVLENFLDEPEVIGGQSI